jgi:hypothetical protein
LIPEEWQPYRIYQYERDLNESKKEIFLFDKQFTNQLSSEFAASLRSKE